MDRSMTEPRNVSLREGAARLGVSPLTLRRMAVYQHRLPYLKMGRRILFRPHDLATFEQSCLVTGGRR
jgi:excisionase family DNA binding protein